MVAIFGLGTTGIEIKPPKIKPIKSKPGIEPSQNLLADSSLGIIILPLQYTIILHYFCQNCY